jgi:hypothetical protein
MQTTVQIKNIDPILNQILIYIYIYIDRQSIHHFYLHCNHSYKIWVFFLFIIVTLSFYFMPCNFFCCFLMKKQQPAVKISYPTLVLTAEFFVQASCIGHECKNVINSLTPRLSVNNLKKHFEAARIFKVTGSRQVSDCLPFFRLLYCYRCFKMQP